MAEDLLWLNEDGYLNVETNVKSIIYHPTLNVLLILSDDNVIHVLDNNSGVVLLSTNLAASNPQGIICEYINGLDRVLFCDGQSIGVRSDYNGVLLLDSILQKPVKDQKECVKLELPLSEAIVLKQSLEKTDAVDIGNIVTELNNEILRAQQQTKRGIKAQKWNTICINLQLDVLRTAIASTISELLLKNQHTLELEITSAIHERILMLADEQVSTSDRPAMASEARRRDTFSHWPHMDYRWALPDQMAQAGFYHQPNATGDDRAMCFTCTICLVSWERSDEPWSEHERHSPNCPFVIGEYTQNVPLSVTYATYPAIDATFRGFHVKVIGKSNVTTYIPTAIDNCLIGIFDVARKITRTHSFYVSQFDSYVLDKFVLDFGPLDTWKTNVETKYTIQKDVTALSIVGHKKSDGRPSLICALKIRGSYKNVETIDASESATRIYLVLYDFQYTREQETKNLSKKHVAEMKNDSGFNKKKSHTNKSVAEQLLSHYKILIPDENDEIILPPQILTNPTQSNDADSDLNQMFDRSFAKSISDHIIDIESSKTTHKLNYSRSVQCVTLPDQYKLIDWTVMTILITEDNGHVLIVLKSDDAAIDSVLLIYRLNFDQKMVKMDEDVVINRELFPNETPIELNLLPVSRKLNESTTNQAIKGNLMMVCADGAVRILELSNLTVLHIARSDTLKFVSATYCINLDRLCASTDDGRIHFYILNESGNEWAENADEIDTSIDGGTFPSQSTAQENNLNKYFENVEMIVPTDLKLFNRLTLFESLKHGYCTVVSPCWSEIQPASQRRYLQNSKINNEIFTRTWRLQPDANTWNEHVFEITLPTSVVLGHVDVQFTLHTSTDLPQIEITLLAQNVSGSGHRFDDRFAVDEGVKIEMLQNAANPVTTQDYLLTNNAEILAGPIDLASNVDLSEKSGVITLTSPKLFKFRHRTLLLHIRAVQSKAEKMKQRKRSGDKSSKSTTGKSRDSKGQLYIGCDCIHEIGLTLYHSKHADISDERTLRNAMFESDTFVHSILTTINDCLKNKYINESLDLLIWIGSIRLTVNKSNNGDTPDYQMEFLKIMNDRLEMLLKKCLLYGDRCIAAKCMKLALICLNCLKHNSECVRNDFELRIMNVLFGMLDDLHKIHSAGGLQLFFALLIEVSDKSDDNVIASKCIALLNQISDELNGRTNIYHSILRSRFGLYGTPFELELFDVELPTYTKGESTQLTYASVVSGEATQKSDVFMQNLWNKNNINSQGILFCTETRLKNLSATTFYRGLLETELLHFNCVSASEGTKLDTSDTENNSLISETLPLTLVSFNSSNKQEGFQVLNEFVQKVAEDINKINRFNVQDALPDNAKMDYCIVDCLEGMEEFPELSEIMESHKNSIEKTKPKTSNNKEHHSWQHLLMPPTQQVIVIERMHSGARRYLTLDFGQPVLLTDIIIPSYTDVVALSVDIWLQDEDTDGVLLAMVSDINTHDLVLNNLSPPPLCRYMKITLVGRYGKTTTRCRLPIGYFYGHTFVASKENSSDDSESNSAEIRNQLLILTKLLEDICCRYNLECTKLKELLKPIIASDTKNVTNFLNYMNIIKEHFGNGDNAETTKIFNVYREIIIYQRQLNVVKHVINRLEDNVIRNEDNLDDRYRLQNTCTDKLCCIAEYLLEVLLTIEQSSNIDLITCQKLFKGFCVTQPSRLQLLAATFLDRICHSAPYWSDFLADTLMSMFNTTNNLIFPQDRVFLLIAYLSQRCPQRNAITDSALRIVYQSLNPLMQNTKRLLAITVDLPLLSWLFIYLSLQLDMHKQFLKKPSRWDWVFGEVGNKSSIKNLSANRKKLCKKINQQNSELLDAGAEKSLQSNEIQALSTLSNHVATLTSKLESSKFHDFLFKKIKPKFKDIKTTPIEYVDVREKTRDQTNVKRSKNSPKIQLQVDYMHCLVVCKGLISFILSTDYSSSADMLLLALKIIGRLVCVAKIKLNQIMNQNELIKLMKICLTSKISWGSHALACLLEDIIEQNISINEDNGMMDVDTSASTSFDTNGAMSGEEQYFEYITQEPSSNRETTPKLTTNDLITLPIVLFESEDSDVDCEIIEENKEATNFTKKPNKIIVKPSQPTNSSAIDLRLYATVELASDISLKKLLAKNAQLFLDSINLPKPAPSETKNLTYWNIDVTDRSETNANTEDMLVECFNYLLTDLVVQHLDNLEHILQLWLTLNCSKSDDKFDPTLELQIDLHPNAIKALISVIAWSSSLSLTTWCITLQTLTLACNSNRQMGYSDSQHRSEKVACIVNHPDFIQLFLQLLSGTGINLNDSNLVGPLICDALNYLLVQLQLPSNNALGCTLKSNLLRITQRLVQISGPIALRRGPIDVQCKFIEWMVYANYSNVDMADFIDIFDSTTVLIQSYSSNGGKVSCINIGDNLSPTPNTFSDIFASVLGTDLYKIDLPATIDSFLIKLIRLLINLLQTKFSNQSEMMDIEVATCSQTDENKQMFKESIRSNSSEISLADLILQRYTSVIRLCQYLVTCKSSSLCMLANMSEKTPVLHFKDPNTVGDAVFQLLITIARKSVNKTATIQALLLFIKQIPELSEPLLWFILQILDSEEAINVFLNAGGITALTQNFINSSNMPHRISQSGTIANIIEHFIGNNSGSDVGSALSSAPTSRKIKQATIENRLSLINFAPYCTIRSRTPTTLPADILIQGTTTTHRRTRTPQWSYFFDPEETYMELVLELPNAILLKEVHLQSHLNNLATCPSAVALEISNCGPSRLVPLSPPLSTSGLVFIRLYLTTPEIVNCILIRLYRPREVNNIGLTQIRLLGTLAFGPQSDMLDDDTYCRHGLGWLRTLHHCIMLPTNVELSKGVIAGASDLQLIMNMCNLLLSPSHIPMIYLSCLEKMLKELSLFDLNNCVTVIRTLLSGHSSIHQFTVNNDKDVQDTYLTNSTGYQAVCELLYQIYKHEDADTPYRIAILLEWLEDVAKQAIESGGIEAINPAYITCVASILWSTNSDAETNYDLAALITPNLFNTIYNLKMNFEKDTPLKCSLDSLLCSLCYIKPEFYHILLQHINVLELQNRFRKNDCGSAEQKKHYLKLQLSTMELETIATASCSPACIQLLLDSGLPQLLSNLIYEFCTINRKDGPISIENIQNMTAILNFFTSVSREATMRDWLGSQDGSFFWSHLLQWLCLQSCSKQCDFQYEAYRQLEEACIKFFYNCSLCHLNNQILLAKVLCAVIKLQSNGVFGFLRRLILQLLLENTKIPVSIKADETLYKNVRLGQTHYTLHPAFRQTHNEALLYMSINTTMIEILDHYVSFNATYKSDNTTNKRATLNRKDAFKLWYIKDSDLSMAAGVTAKDKRTKDAKNHFTAIPQSKKKRYTNFESLLSGNMIGNRLIKCKTYSDDYLPLNLTLSQLLQMIKKKGVITTNWPCIHLTIHQHNAIGESGGVDANLSYEEPLVNFLQVFSYMGGLALLAQHLPTIYPETFRQPSTKRSNSDPSEFEWIKVEDCDDIYEDIEESVFNSPSKAPGLMSNIPSHSLIAFSLFLRLPGYAEVLLQDMKKAMCLLRLMLGVTDDDEGSDIFQSAVVDMLPTLPFEILKILYDSKPLDTEDGRLLRQLSVNNHIVHLLLACLGIFTHQTRTNGDKDSQSDWKNKEEKSQQYWAKGTGFGTGSTQQSWNVEQALLKQRNEEEHVTILLEVLACYISPSNGQETELQENALPPGFHDILAGSALLPALCSYLRNDSVLDMARHIPLYRSALKLLQALAISPQLVDLLLPSKSDPNEPSVNALLKNMQFFVDTYTLKLGINKKSASKSGEDVEEFDETEGLATLLPGIQKTANLVSKATSCLIEMNPDSLCGSSTDNCAVVSIEETYLKIMKNLQFGSYEMITESSETGIKFVVSHHFESNAKSVNEQSHPTRVKRIAQEAVTLSTSLPLSYSSSVFVRYDASRLDVMKVLITGPSDTPYENGCFEFDVFFPSDYPLSPMMINLETTGHHSVRFNPNLYNDGKVCLSILNTWHGRPEEKWNAQTSSFLQVLVSIQSLILVSEPYFNEPGYERSRGTPAGTQSSKEYNANVRQATVRWAMLEQLINPSPCFEDIIHTHFYMKRYEIIEQISKWINELENDVTEKKVSKIANKTKVPSPTNIDAFKKLFRQLKERLSKLKPIGGVESVNKPPNSSEPDSNCETEPEDNDDIDMKKLSNSDI